MKQFYETDDVDLNNLRYVKKIYFFISHTIQSYLALAKGNFSLVQGRYF